MAHVQKDAIFGHDGGWSGQHITMKLIKLDEENTVIYDHADTNYQIQKLITQRE